jgi:archaellum component FlaC
VQLRKRAQSGTTPFSSKTQGDGSTSVLPILASDELPDSFAKPNELAEGLSGMAASLSEADPKAAERLADLSHSIGTEKGRLKWADVDLRRAFNTERLAHSYAVRREGGYAPPSVDRADKIRNVMVLMPILLTWTALGEAVIRYRQYIDAHPEQTNQPFLLLWQRNFGEGRSFFTPTFSTVALIDALIIFVIIMLTFYSHGRREAHEERIATTANAFQNELDNELAESTVLLASNRGNRPAMLVESVGRLADRFDITSQELLTRLRVEHDRLESIAARREKEFNDFGVFASGMRAGAEETHRLLVDLRQLSTGLQTALEDLTSEIGIAGDQQRTLLGAVASLDRLVASGIQSDQAVTRQLGDTAKSLADAADKALAGSEAAAQAGRVATDAVRGIAELSSGLVTSQVRVETAVAAEAEANSRLADTLRGSTGGVTSATKALSEISASLNVLRDEFGRIVQLSSDQSTSLSRLLTEQNTIATGLSQVARDLSAVGITTSQRQREVNEEVASLVRRLDNLTTVLAKATGGTDQLHTDFDAPGGESFGQQAEVASRRDRSLWPRRE